MDILGNLIVALLCLVGLGLCYFIVIVSQYIKLKLKQAKEKLPFRNNEVIGNIFDCAASVISKTAAASVGKLEQIIGKDLRQLVKDGKASRDELLALAEDAYNEILDTVSPQILEDLESCVDNSEDYIRNVIETELLKLKSGLSS